MDKLPPPPLDFNENPEWTDATQARSRLASDLLPPHVVAALTRRPGRPAGSEKQQVTMRLDKDVLAYFRAGGTGWQTRLNAALRASAGL